MQLGVGLGLPYNLGKPAAAFSPLDLSPVLWLDAADTSTITEVGGAVSQWDDKSGNGYHVTQGTAAYQPTSGTRTLNGLNVLDFNAAVQNLRNLSFTFSQPVIVFAAVETDTTTNERLIVGGTSLSMEFGQLGNSNLLVRAANTLSSTGGEFTATSHVVTGIFNTTSSSGKIDGTEVLTGDVGAGSFSRLNVGSRDNLSRVWDGAIAEIIIVDGTLTAGQIAATESYFADKWGITL